MSAVAERTKSVTWTCDHCDMTVQWMPGHEKKGLPAHWKKEKGNLYCLACRRERAAEIALDKADDGLSIADRAKLQSTARVHFEVNRTPDRPAAEIAKVCSTSIAAVQKARKELGISVATN